MSGIPAEGPDLPLISEHDTWLDVEPVLGCPARCAYCFTQNFGLAGVRPVARESPEGAAAAVEAYLREDPFVPGAFHPCVSRLVCVGNYTDLFLSPSGQRFAIEFTRHFSGRCPKVPVVFISKARLTQTLVDELDGLKHPIVFFVTQSFFGWSEEGTEVEHGVSTPEETAASLDLLSASSNLKPLHFWRPITRINTPNPEAAVAQLRLVRDAGAIASVAVGLKAGASLRVRFSDPTHPLRVATEEAVGPLCPKGEWFPEDLREMVLRCAKHLEHPVYLNTSCAVSLALNRPEFLGTWEAPVREARCLPTTCPRSQRSLCGSVGRRGKPTASAAKAVAEYLTVPKDAVSVGQNPPSIEVNAILGQDEQCRLSHVSGFRVQCWSLDTTREWTGVGLGMGRPDGQAGMCGDLGIDSLPEGARLLIDRMRGVTGMISPLTALNPRLAAFDRYSHIRREVAVAVAAARRIKESGGTIDDGRVATIAWLHDLNRFPFAHQGERGLYSPRDDLERFLSDAGACNDPSLLEALVAVEEKRYGVGMECRVALAATQAVGATEDLLFAITAFGLRPSSVPDFVGEVLRLPLRDRRFIRKLAVVRRGFLDGAPAVYAREMNFLVTAHAWSCVMGACTSWGGFELSSRFAKDLRRVREEYLSPVLFPIANEGVGKGIAQREKVVAPLAKHFGCEHVDKLTTLSDQGAIDLAVQLGILSRDDVSSVVPDLDYIRRCRPDLLFEMSE